MVFSLCECLTYLAKYGSQFLSCGAKQGYTFTSFDFNFVESHSLRFNFARSLEMMSSDLASSSGGMTMGLSKSKVLSK